jgi:predicted metal-dependent phosphoesterase TrpH
VRQHEHVFVDVTEKGREILRVDLHVHTRYSPDATLKPRELIARARHAGFDRIAITDHNTMEGAYEARSIDPDFIIMGEEIDTAEGTDLIGLFLEQAIPRGLPLAEVAARIREQDGIVYAPHPFAYLYKPGAHSRRVLDAADVVEAVNSRAFLPRWNQLAQAGARARGLPVAAGTDAHFPHEVGRAWTEMPTFQDVTQFRLAIRHAVPVLVNTSGPFVHIASLSLEALRRTGAVLTGRGSTKVRWAPSENG